jgi:DNA-binding NarL/FixJ family response regulator
MKNLLLAVADDHDGIRQTITNYLKQNGYKVIMEATDGQHLIDQLAVAHTLPHICLLDYNMPGLNGSQVAKIINQRLPGIRTIALTSETGVYFLIEMLKSGVSAYVTKSQIPRGTLCEAIDTVATQGYYFSDWMQTNVLEYFRGPLYNFK